MTYPYEGTTFRPPCLPDKHDFSPSDICYVCDNNRQALIEAAKKVLEILDIPDQSNLVDHAQRELTILGVDQEEITWFILVIRAFGSYGHSGSSAVWSIPIINDLLQFKNLTPITDNPNEWVHHEEPITGDPDGVWQSVRNCEAFSNDGGKTYYLLSEGGNNYHREPLHDSVKSGFVS